MTFELLNPAMLLGLAGLVLPPLLYLLNRRTFDVIPWGAMQFLEATPKERRKVRRDDLLLLALRIGTLGVIVVALSGLTVSGLPYPAARAGRDVVILIDGSYSMGWEGTGVTPHAEALQFVHRMLDGMQPGDTAAVLDVRETGRQETPSLTRDPSRIRTQLNRLALPAGSCDLAGSLVEALRLVRTGNNPRREIVVLTDGQARAWSPDDAVRWATIDDLLTEAAVRPQIHVVDVGDREIGARSHFSLDRLERSRDVTAVNLPVRISTRLRHRGSRPVTGRKVYLEVDGQRLADATIETPALSAGAEFPVAFEHRFRTSGSHVIGVRIDADPLPVDDRADAAITVLNALRVLIVDGDPQPDPTRAETFFIRAASGSEARGVRLVEATFTDAAQFQPQDLSGRRVAVLANVARLSAAQADALTDFVDAGSGLLIAPGDQVAAEDWNRLSSEKPQLLAASFDSIRGTGPDHPSGLRIRDSSLTLPLLASFRHPHAGGLTDARFSQWWRLTADPAIVAMQFDNGDPALLLKSSGRGKVGLLAFPLDSDWSTLPAQPDFVALLHELLFHLAGSDHSPRNILQGEPLVVSIPSALQGTQIVVQGPAGSRQVSAPPGDPPQSTITLNDLYQPGNYLVTSAPVPAGRQVLPELHERFVVDFDRQESDLTRLTHEYRAQLSRNDRLRFADGTNAVAAQRETVGSRRDLGPVLILVVLALLVLELCMTRRLVRGACSGSSQESSAFRRMDVEGFRRDSSAQIETIGNDKIV